MFERFSDRARKVMALANQEAQRFNHEYIGTEHILLGLIKEGSGVGANVLKSLDVDLHGMRREVEQLLESRPNMINIGRLPQTPQAKRVVQYAIEEARGMNHNYIGSEHLLLGLLREEDGVAAQTLTNLGLNLDQVREEVSAWLRAWPEVTVVSQGSRELDRLGQRICSRAWDLERRLKHCANDAERAEAAGDASRANVTRARVDRVENDLSQVNDDLSRLLQRIEQVLRDLWSED